MKLAELKRNLKAEAEGEWNDAPELGVDEETGKPIQLLTRSVHYPPFKMDLQQTQLRLARKYGDDIPPEVQDRENGRLYATHLLLDWKGIDETFTPELALATLQDLGQRDLRESTVACARLCGKRRQAQAAAIEGN